MVLDSQKCSSRCEHKIYFKNFSLEDSSSTIYRFKLLYESQKDMKMQKKRNSLDRYTNISRYRRSLGRQRGGACLIPPGFSVLAVKNVIIILKILVSTCI